MSRSNGNGRRSGRRTTLTLFQRALILSASLPIFRAAGHITLDGDDLVVSIHDDNDDAHVLTQSDPAKRCAAPAAHAAFGGRLCLSMIGGLEYVSNRSVSYWGALQAEAGAIYDTTAPLGTSIQVVWEDTSPPFSASYIQHYIASGPVHRFEFKTRHNPTVSQGLSRGVPTVDVVQLSRFRRSAASIWARTTGLSEVTLALSVTPDGSNPSRSLAIGRAALASNYRIGHLMFFPALDSAGYDLVDQWFASEGIAA